MNTNAIYESIFKTTVPAAVQITHATFTDEQLDAVRAINPEYPERLTAPIDPEIALVVSALVAATPDGQVVDNHRTNGKTIKAGGFAIMGDGQVALLLSNALFCLNWVYVDAEDGKSHLSTWSIAGNVNAKGKTLRQAVTDYNAERIDYMQQGVPCVNPGSMILGWVEI